MEITHKVFNRGGLHVYNWDGGSNRLQFLDSKRFTYNQYSEECLKLMDFTLEPLFINLENE